MKRFTTWGLVMLTLSIHAGRAAADHPASLPDPESPATKGIAPAKSEPSIAADHPESLLDPESPATKGFAPAKPELVIPGRQAAASSSTGSGTGWKLPQIFSTALTKPDTAAAPPATAETGCVPQAPCVASACCDSCCECGHYGLVGGAGIYLVQPYFQNNHAFTVANGLSIVTTGFGEFNASDKTDIRHHVDVAPELWIGYIGENGLGGRLRWWYFRQGTDQSIAAPNANGNPDQTIFIASAAPLGLQVFAENVGQDALLSVTSKLQVQVYDLEALQSYQTANWDLLFAGGLRLAHLNQHYNAFANGGGVAVFGEGIVHSESLVSSHSFHGVGPEVAIEGRRYLGGTGLALYGSLRGALLFGSAKQTASLLVTYTSEPDENILATDHRDRVLPVAEVEVGVEAGRRVGNSRVFGQIALVGQEWWGAGSASRDYSTTFFGVPFGSASGDSDFGFFGAAFRLGVNY